MHGPDPLYAVLRGAAGLEPGADERDRLYHAARAALTEELDGHDGQVSPRRRKAMQRQLAAAIRRLEDDIAHGPSDAAARIAWGRPGPGPGCGDGPSEPLFPYQTRRRQRLRVTPQLLDSLLQRQRNVRSLVIRFLREAEATDPLSQIWTVVEPIMQIGIVVAIYLLLDRHLVLDMPAAPFATTGVGAWLMMRVTLARLSAGPGPPQGLLALPRIAPIDVLLARALVVNLMYGCGLAILLSGLIWAGIGAPPDDPLGVLFYWMLIWAIGLGLGLTLARIARTVSTVRRMMPIALRIMVFVSGVVFVSEQMPKEVAGWLVGNPLLHAMQLLRSAYFAEYTTDHGRPVVAIGLALVCLTLGLMSQRAERRRTVQL